jgi:hypothetical protein
MARRPTPAPADEPQEEDDLVLPVNAPRPVKAENTHPVRPAEVVAQQGTQVPILQGTSGGYAGDPESTLETRAKGEQVPRGKGEEVAVKQGTLPARPTEQELYPGRKKIGVRIDDALKRELKVAAALHDRTEESIVIEAVRAWLRQNPPPAL